MTMGVAATPEHRDEEITESIIRKYIDKHKDKLRCTRWDAF